MQGVRPHDDFPRIVAFLRPGMRAFHQRIGLLLQFHQALRNANRICRRIAKRCGNSVDGAIQLRIRRVARVRTSVPRGLAHQRQIVGDAGMPARVHDRARDHLAAGIAERDQMPREIAAIHGGDVFRLKRAKIACVVPIEEMAAEALQLLHCREGRFEALHRTLRSKPAEIARRDNGQQIKAHIGRRGAVGDDRPGIFLEIVRRQHVVFRGDEFFEEAPGAPRDQP